MTSRTPAQRRVTLDVRFKIDVGAPFSGQLASDELIRSVDTVLTIAITNQGNKSFPGGEFEVKAEEHGTVPAQRPLAWTWKGPKKISRLRPGELWEETFVFTPILEGLGLFKVTLTSVRGNTLSLTDIVLTGFRSSPKQWVEFHYFVVNREILELKASIDKLAETLRRR